MRRCRQWKARWFPANSLRSRAYQTIANFVRGPIGLTDGGERVTPQNPNDCYVAHLSIYDFATEFTRGKRILDAGCGAGYGSNYLLTMGRAERVEGVDISTKAIRYCRRHYRDARLHFQVGDLFELGFEDKCFDFIFASNVLEHVPDIDDVLNRLALKLSEDGTMLIAVPPVLTQEQLFDNFRNPYHLNNFHPRQWVAMVERFFETVAVLSHGARPGIRLDFGSEEPSKCVPEDFIFTPVALSRLEDELKTTLTVVIIAERPRRIPVVPVKPGFPLFENQEIEETWRAAEPDRRKVFSASGNSGQYDDQTLRKRIYPLRTLVESSGAEASEQSARPARTSVDKPRC